MYTKEQLGKMETIDIHKTQAGDTVVFLGRNGYDAQLKKAMEILDVGDEYVVMGLDIGSSYTDLYLVGFKQPFNSVMFGAK